MKLKAVRALGLTPRFFIKPDMILPESNMPNETICDYMYPDFSRYGVYPNRLKKFDFRKENFSMNRCLGPDNMSDI